MVKLNLGCGGDKREGYVNIDVREDVEPDLKLDLETEGLPFSNNTVEEILMIDFLEHISFHRVLKLLKECHRVLIHGGKIEVRVPDLFRIFMHYLDGKIDSWDKMSYYICGGQDYEENFHKAVFWRSELERLLIECGFKIVESYYDNSNVIVKAEKSKLL